MSSRRFLPTHPAPSRSPSSTSASDADADADASLDNEEESADDSDFLDPDDSLTAAEDRVVPALATPKPNALAPWPYTSPSQSSPTRPAIAELDEDEPAGPPIIPASSLPHEILLHILRLLPSSSLGPAILVCKSWCQCGVELLWHKPTFPTLASLTLLLSVVTSPDQTFPYHLFVRRLNFTALQSEMNDGILRMLRCCSRLERLTLTGCKDLTSGAIVDLVNGCERLVALDLSDVQGTDDAVVETVARRCERLQGLNLSGCKKVTDKGVEAIALGCPGLRRIKLRAVEALTDTPIVLLSLHCPLLLEVDLISCPLISAISLLQLFRTSHHLRELSLQACTAITDAGFPPPQSSLLVAADPLPPLVTQRGLQVAQPLPLSYQPQIRQFDHLRYLDLTSLNLISDDAVRGIVKHAPRIRNLILAKCAHLTDDAVEAICGLGKHLHYLHMGHMLLITDSAVMKLARSCTRLRYIDLACCNLLTDMAVFELAAQLPRLKRIGLVRVTNLTDAAIYALFARSTLERIHLSYCDNLTVQAIHELLQHLPKLTHLSLTGVSSFRRPDLQTWCRPPPKEFNAHQRQSFCVYSGKGVLELRRYLRSLTNAEADEAANPRPLPVAAPAPRAARVHRHHRVVLPPHQPAAQSHPAPAPRRQFNPVAGPSTTTQFPQQRQIPIQLVPAAPPATPVAGPSNGRVPMQVDDDDAQPQTRPRRATVTRGNFLDRRDREPDEMDEDSESDEDEDERMG